VYPSVYGITFYQAVILGFKFCNITHVYGLHEAKIKYKLECKFRILNDDIFYTKCYRSSATCSVVFQHTSQHFAQSYAIWKIRTQQFSLRSQEKHWQMNLKFVVPVRQVLLVLICGLQLWPNTTDRLRTSQKPISRSCVLALQSQFVSQSGSQV
jgi:hypothetical protein